MQAATARSGVSRRWMVRLWVASAVTLTWNCSGNQNTMAPPPPGPLIVIVTLTPRLSGATWRVGDTIRMSASANIGGVSGITWEVSAPVVAGVDGDGVLVARAQGSTVVTARLQFDNGTTATGSDLFVVGS